MRCPDHFRDDKIAINYVTLKSVLNYLCFAFLGYFRNDSIEDRDNHCVVLCFS